MDGDLTLSHKIESVLVQTAWNYWTLSNNGQVAPSQKYFEKSAL